jgi:hypothetical protein
VIFYQERITADGFIVPARFTFPEPLKGKYIVNFFGAIALSELGFSPLLGRVSSPQNGDRQTSEKTRPLSLSLYPKSNNSTSAFPRATCTHP